MAVSRLIPAGGANDFNLSLAGTYTSVVFNKEYASGSYSIVSNSGDATFDIYAYNNDGSLAGYTKTGSFTASKGFNKMVILGGTTGDVLSFSYKTTFVTVDDSDEVTAGPVATSVSPSAAPKVDDTFTLTGRNFASDCTVTFTSANTAYTATQAKSIVRSSPTSLIVTRPDNLPSEYSPYTLTVQNPGVSNPTGTNSHILANALTAGSTPVWVTGATLSRYSFNSAYSTTLQATDADAGSAITYSIVSGALPSGLTLAGATGVISGTPTTSVTQASFTVRATDAGGNFVDRGFTLFNTAPVWVTSGTLAGMTGGQAYSVQLSATDDASITYSLASGTLPTGITLSSSGLLSGTPSNLTPGSFNITVNATDGAGNVTTSGTLTIPTIPYVFTSFTFTNAGVNGRTGPSLAQVQSAYSATSWTQNTQYLNMSTTGIQQWVVPQTATYRIQTTGAAGGRACDNPIWGYGASMRGDFSLTAGQVVNILVGQGGIGASNNGTSMAAGGGGGTAVWLQSSNTEPLIVAGGGAGGTDSPADYGGRHSNVHATTATSGRNGYTSGAGARGSGGSDGNGGSVATANAASTQPSAGAGYKSNGGSNGQGNFAEALKTSGNGGLCNTGDGSRNNNGGGSFHGGFGGGGGAAGWYGCSGGGGGYSGGGTGDDNPRVAAGGGGSYNAGTNQVNSEQANASNSSGIGAAGSVVITRLQE